MPILTKGNRKTDGWITYARWGMSWLLVLVFIPVDLTAVQVQNQQKNIPREISYMTMLKESKTFYKTDFDTEISVHVFDVTVEQALREIAAITGMRLTYRGDIMKQKKVTLVKDKISISDALDHVLQKTNLDYMFSRDGYLLIYQSLSELNKMRAQIEVEGTVIDGETGEPLPGVNISVEGTTKGTTTNVEGKFSLEVAGPESVLIFSFIGYKTQKITVGEQRTITIVLEQDLGRLDEVIVVGYGTQERSDLTGSVERLEGETFKDQNITQLSDMFTGTIAGFEANQSSNAAGGSSMQIRGTNSLQADTEPMIVLDGAVYNGSLRDINPNDIETIDVLKDASSAAIYGAKAASGVILLTTTKGAAGKPTINFSSEVGFREPLNDRRPYGPMEYIQFRKDYFRTVFPDQPEYYYTHPDNLPDGISLEEWRNYSDSNLSNDIDEYLSRLRFFPEEQEVYKAGNSPADETIDWYDVVMRRGVQQSHNLSIEGGSEDAQYYWSIGYDENEGIRVGDQYSAIRSRLNVNFDILEWLSASANIQWSDRNETSIPGSLGFYSNSPFARQFDEDGNLKRRPHGHTNHPLLNYYRFDQDDRNRSLFSNLSFDIGLPFGFEHNVSFQPRYEYGRFFSFMSTDESVGGLEADISTGSRSHFEAFEWRVDNLLTWKKEFGIHDFDVTLLHTVERNREWSSSLVNQRFSPNQELSYHGIGFGVDPGVGAYDMTVSGDGMMARLNYSLLSRYLITASIRRDGYSAFGQDLPRANFPSVAFAWRIAQEDFFDVDWVEQLKMRLSWGINGNREIGAYAALADVSSQTWYDGTSTRVGSYINTIGNPDLAWERTESINIGLDVSFFASRINVNLDYYDARTSDLLMNRQLPSLTGFDNVTVNLGELGNRGFEMSFNSVNINSENLSWNSNFVFSLNRNKVRKLFGDTGEYRLLGQSRTGEIPDFDNEWFPGRALDEVWDYDIIGVWQEDEAEEAEKYGMRPGDFKAVDPNDDNRYVDLDDKRFIGFLEPRYRLGLRNQVDFLGNWSASVFVRADLGHIGGYPEALNGGAESNDRRSRNVGPVPYWTPENTINDYARLDVSTSGYGGGLMIYKPRSFVRIQDATLSYTVTSEFTERVKLRNMRVYVSGRNLATFTNWPHWDPETGRTPLARSFMMGVNLAL
ncbi:SusC/RagA family TonB-linked outer membrane protein [Fodinibius sediminis]|uniref:TonB-linked outer membrane protein, SusC/RagA family n=1 Tax=Fodinibius sediminis TaxID=1214077 RepID=A0A521CTF1_9BACT|nr:SusC/RagA family TonB-linked outer membrane protein [Fodinibius sediminis]SMO62754.1 TonB-linked outer membrane protein, SusC/RagA family [Fodinibius sediminis]